MSIVKDSYELDLTDPGFVHIAYTRVVKNAGGVSNDDASLWFAHQNLQWLADALSACITTYGAPRARSVLGGDDLAVWESGPEPEPYVNIENDRPAGSEHAGGYWISMSAALAAKLVEELRLVASKAAAGKDDGAP